MAKRRTFVAALISLVCAFVLVFSLGMMTACGNDETVNGGSETAETVGGAWYYGAALPSNALGVSGDYYLNTTTLLSYIKDGQVWRLAANGEAGTWYHGTTAPDGNEGTEGDFYLNVQTGDLYQKKSDGWGQPILTLKGEKGRDGVIWFSGEGEPGSGPNAPQDAMKGDFYIDTTTWKVYQYQADKTWEELGSIRGEDAKDAVQFFNGNGEPSEEITAKAHEGDLYLGQFTGFEDGADGSGSKLYRYLHGEWVVLMESMTKNQINIYTYEDLVQFRTSVASGTSYSGKKVHLKTDLTFTSPAGASLRKARAVVSEAWTPIGTQTHPFKGTFDGEGHTIENFTTQTTESATAVGFFGYVDGATIEHLHFENAHVTVSGTESVGAVVVGQAAGNVTVRDVVVESSHVAAEEGAKVGGLVGKVQDGTVTAEQVDVSAGNLESNEKASLVGEGNVTLEGSNAVGKEIAPGFVEKHHMNGEAVESTTYEISSAEGLQYFAKTVNGDEGLGLVAKNYTGETVQLVADIDLKNVEWTPIGAGSNKFEGTFDGTKNATENYTISNLTYNNSEQSCVGFFGTVNGTVRNLVFSNANITGKGKCGVLAGTVSGTISGITIQDGNVTAAGTGTDANYVGGLAGSGSGRIENIKIIKTRVSTPSTLSGGVVGDGYATFSNIRVSGCTVEGNAKAGGVIGQWQEDSNRMENVIVSNSKVCGQQDIGMLVGFMNCGDKTFDTCSIESCMIEAKNFSTPAEFKNFGGFVGTAKLMGTQTISFNACKIDAGKELTFKGNSITGVGGFVGNLQYGKVNDVEAVTISFSSGTTCNIILEKQFKYAGVFAGNNWKLQTKVTYVFENNCSGAGYIESTGKYMTAVIGRNECAVSGNPDIHS